MFFLKKKNTLRYFIWSIFVFRSLGKCFNFKLLNKNRDVRFLWRPEQIPELSCSQIGSSSDKQEGTLHLLDYFQLWRDQKLEGWWIFGAQGWWCWIYLCEWVMSVWSINHSLCSVDWWEDFYLYGPIAKC